MGVLWPQGWGFPQQTSAKAGANTAGKKKGSGSQVRHSALAEPLAPPLRLQGCLREKPWPPNSLLPPLPGKQHPQPPRVMVIRGLAVHLEHFQSPPPLVAHSPHGRAPLGHAGPPQPPSLPCHPLSRAKTCCRPVLPATSQRETQLQVQPAFNAGRHWGGHSTTSPGRSTTKSCSPSWAGSEPPCQRRREASSRWAHVLLKKKRSFLHQMEHFLLNNTPILICTKKIAPCISTSCICHLLLPAPTTWAAPWLPDRHMACAKPCPVLSEMGRRKTSHRQCPALGAGASSISAEPHQHQASILCHQ